MAKKRKARTSEPQQPDPPRAEPEPAQEQVPLEEEEEEEVEEEVEEEIEEGDEEEVDYEENKAEDNAVSGAKNSETLENANGTNNNNNNSGSNDGVSAEQAKANGAGGEKVDDLEEDEPVEKLLEPFTKDQLVSLLKEAVSEHPGFIENVKKLADLDPVHRKIFVHGLGWDTTTETLTEVFGKYGEIEDCKAVVDKATGKSKGYGFILFKHRSGAKRALKEPQKKIGNRMTSCQLASAGPTPAPPPTAPPVSEYTQRKIFVSNVGTELDPNKLLEFFSKFGEVEEGPLGLDKQTGKPKGFCLFVYKSVESAKKALEEPHKNFEGHTLHCQKAVDGPKPGKGGAGGSGYYQQQQHQQHHGQHHHSQQQYYGHTAKKGKYSGGSGSSGTTSTGGHLMAPSAGSSAVGFNPAVAPAAISPAIGQALAILATQGAGLGFGNLLGGIGAPGNQGVAPGGYGGQGATGYGVQPGLQGGYQNPQIGQGGVRPPQGGGPYMGHGH